MADGMKPSGALARTFSRIFQSYCWIVVGHPVILIIFTLLISITLSAIGIVLHYNVIDFDPKKGFETRGTPLSEGKLILDSIAESVATPMEIYRHSFLKEKRGKRSSDYEEDFAIELLNKTEEALIEALDYIQENNSTTLEPISINYEDYGVDSDPNINDLSDPCTQYSAMGNKIPYDAFDILAKIIVETKPGNLFTLETFKSLCEVDNLVKSTLKGNGQQKLAISQLEHSFNLPLISTCLNLKSRKTCENLNQKDIDFLQQQIEDCKNPKHSQESKEDKCSLPMIQQAIHYLLPQDSSTLPNQAAIVLNIQRSSDPNSTVVFDKILATLKNHFKQSVIELKGVDFGNKAVKFQSALFFDSLLSLVSASCVLCLFFVYTRSFFFSGIILLLIVLSMTLAFFTYTVILGINFFPFINLLVIVLMTSVGADDAFLLLSYYRNEKQKFSTPWKPGDVYLPPDSLHIRCLQKSIRHSLISMFITSATTAVAFLSNLSSEIIVLRCFGIYACLTVVFNYLLVVFVLPSVIMITQSDSSLIKLPVESIVNGMIWFIHKLRFLIVIIGVVLTSISIYAVFWKPGLRTPMYNPTTLLVESSPYEWFDNNAHFYDFKWKRTFKIQKYFIFGDISASGISMLSPKKSEKTNFHKLILNQDKLDHLQTAISTLLDSSKFDSGNSWIHDFQNFSCAEPISNCLLSFSSERLPSTFPDDFSKFPIDGPLFDKKLDLIGYFAGIPSNITLTATADKVIEAFAQIQKDCSKIKATTDIPVLCLSSSDIASYYDIIQRLWPSTMSSVGISIAVSLVVVILCTRKLVLSLITVAVIIAVVIWTTAVLVALGWQMSVVESTIIVLTIGLSFDFSLHIAASVKDSREVTMVEKLRSSLRSAGTACSLAALSSIICGLPLLFARTAAFYQVGTMLVTLGFTSIFGAVLMLPAILLCVSNDRQKREVSRF